MIFDAILSKNGRNATDASGTGFPGRRAELLAGLEVAQHRVEAQGQRAAHGGGPEGAAVVDVDARVRVLGGHDRVAARVQDAGRVAACVYREGSSAGVGRAPSSPSVEREAAFLDARHLGHR